MSGYQVTGEPGAFDDAEAFQIYQTWGRTLDPDPALQALERLAFRSRPCMFGRMFLRPDDFQQLRQLGEQRVISRPPGSAPSYGPLFGVPVLVDVGAPEGVYRLDHCTNTQDHADCKYAEPVWLDTRTGRRHDSPWCAGVSSAGSCIDGTRYEACGSDSCEGDCIDVGSCGCSCHQVPTR